MESGGARLRVCHVIHSLQPGGAEQLLVELASVAPAAGLDMSVLSLLPAGNGLVPRALRTLDVPVATLDLAGRWDPRALGRAVSTVRAIRPHLVHTHLKHADLVGGLAAARVGAPQVSTLHLLEDEVRGTRRGKRWLATTVRGRAAARTIAVSDAVRRWYVEASGADPERVVTLHNGVVDPPPLDPRRRQALRAELGAGADTVLAVMVGIMRPGKGHGDLVAAAARVSPDIPLRVVLVGDGELRAHVEATVAGSRAPEGRLHVAGFRTDVSDVLSVADLVVQPSRFDALPTALLSALAAGRPVIATRAGGIPEIVTPETGVLVTPGDVGALAEALATLAGDAPRRLAMQVAARDRFLSEFEAAGWARRLRRLYEEVLAERGVACG